MDQLFELVEKYNFPIQHISPTHVARTKDLFDQAINFALLGGIIDITTGASKYTEPHFEAVIKGIDSGVKIGNMTFSTDGHAGLSVFDKRKSNWNKKAPVDANLKQFTLLIKNGGLSIKKSCWFGNI
ncbi:MAG: hypothetical protein CM15mP59_0190 [Flavobacteriaceae bacterium]|nr:MAG: hypothetical protein CM15mP59_0190 [Flavobacteriaceae bacterium]